MAYRIRPQQPGPCRVCGADLVAWHPVIGYGGHIPGCGDVARAIGAILAPDVPQLEPSSSRLDRPAQDLGERRTRPTTPAEQAARVLARYGMAERLRPATRR